MVGKNSNNIGFKCQTKLCVVFFLGIIALLFTLSFIELHTLKSTLLQQSTLYQNSRRSEEYNLVIMTTVDFVTSDIDLLQNWTSLFMASKQVRLIVFTADDVTKLKLLNRFPNVDFIPLNADMTMCNMPRLLSLNAMFEIAKEKYKSHFYAFLNDNVVISNEIEQTIGNFVRDYQYIAEKETLILARSRIVQDRNMALQVLNAVSKPLALEVKYTLGDSSDVFITNRLFEWSIIPNMIAHQITTSQVLAVISRQKRIVLVDVTNLAYVIRTRKDKRYKKPSRHVNRCVRNMLVQFGIDSKTLITCGNIMCVGYMMTSSKGQTEVTSREMPFECNECNYPVHADASWLPW